jgi:ABC-type multidrug transport system ATPase subunit
MKAGKKSGTILFNGKDPRDANYTRAIGFVPQQDTHVGASSRVVFLSLAASLCNHTHPCRVCVCVCVCAPSQPS